MATMQSEVYEAFRSLNVPDDKALAAATALGARDASVDKLETKIDKVDTKVTMLQWMIGIVITLQVLLIGRLLLVH